MIYRSINNVTRLLINRGFSAFFFPLFVIYFYFFHFQCIECFAIFWGDLGEVNRHYFFHTALQWESTIYKFGLIVDCSGPSPLRIVRGGRLYNLFVLGRGGGVFIKWPIGDRPQDAHRVKPNQFRNVQWNFVERRRIAPSAVSNILPNDEDGHSPRAIFLFSPGRSRQMAAIRRFS